MARRWRAALAGALAVVGIAATSPGAGAQPIRMPFDTNPLLPENAVRKISPHAYVIMGFPNVGIVVGRTGTLVVDTGLGARNGALVAHAALKLSRPGAKLYLTTTHFHPEHASGQGGFPPGTVVIRPKVQQAELERDGPRMLGFFASRSAEMKQLLDGAGVGKADVLFDREHDLDLGGVHVRLLWLGHAHTEGDESVFVQEDSLLFPGDIVQDRISPNFTCEDCSPARWIAVIDKLAPLKPRLVAPDHGALGDGALVGRERAFLAELQARAMALKAEGRSAEEAGRVIQAEFQARHADWGGLNNIPAAVNKAYAAP
jgi:glyoxylase-like metal-dependent hydrolase (beta-lactamase superfamily II)